MVRWIDASPAQRVAQYLLPAARRALASGEHDRAMANYAALVDAEKAR